MNVICALNFSYALTFHQTQKESSLNYKPSASIGTSRALITSLNLTLLEKNPRPVLSEERCNIAMVEPAYPVHPTPTTVPRGLNTYRFCSRTGVTDIAPSTNACIQSSLPMCPAVNWLR